MTIQEAIQSGKQFSRGFDWIEQSDYQLGLTREDILATDWEVLVCEEHQIRVTQILLPTASAAWHEADWYCDYCEGKEQKQQPKTQYVTLHCTIAYTDPTHNELCACIKILENSDSDICQCGSDSVSGGGHSDWCPKVKE